MKKNLLFICCLLSLYAAKAQLSATVYQDAASCLGNDGVASVVAAGASSYKYKWSNGDSTNIARNLAPGTYTVTVYGTMGGMVNVNSIYTENFDGPQTWTINIPTGSNDSQHNIWSINDTCGGGAVYSCAGNRNGDKTLNMHSTTWFPPYTYIGALYNATGPDEGYYIGTDLAAQSPAISTVGASNLNLSFDFICNGQGLEDNGSCYYSIDSGNTFVLLDPSLKSLIGSCDKKGVNIGEWTHRSYSLPSSCNNIKNFMVRFRWVNNEDDIGTDPALAVNNVVLGDSISYTGAVIDSIVDTAVIGTGTPVVANFVVYAVDSNIYYAHNTSTGGALHFEWHFGDGTSWGGCCPLYAFATAGYWSVCLTATNQYGCSDTYCDSLFYNAFKNAPPLMKEFIVDSTGSVATGVQNQVMADASVDIFPNPASGLLNVMAHNFQPAQMVIYNVTGSKVLEEKYRQQLDIKELPAGLYFIEVSDNHSTIRNRFLKM